MPGCSPSSGVPMSAHIDTIEVLTMQERAGAIVGLTREAIVTGLTGVPLEKLYAALDAAGVPVYGTVLDAGRGKRVFVTDRNVKMLDRDTASVTITYESKESKRSTENGTSVVGKMTASVAQVDTNLYRENGRGEQLPVALEHTYPDDDPDFAGQTIKQAGQMKVFVPQRTFTCDGVRATLTPWTIVDTMIGCVNRAAWMGGGPREWMCTEVTWEVQGYMKYLMAFTFQHNEDTWDPTVTFIDSRTNRPPKDLMAGKGYKTVPYHRPIDFSQHIGFRVAGA